MEDNHCRVPRRALALAVLGLFLSVSVAHANHIPPPPAPRIIFTPVGTQLDGDMIDDILTTPGALITFQVRIDTLNLASFGSVSYVVDYDISELELFDFTLPPPGLNPFPNHSVNSLGGGSLSLGHRNVEDMFGVPIPSIPGGGFVYRLDDLTFQVLPGLANTGVFDFRVRNAGVNTITGFFGINANQEVEVQPVPEPATWMLIGFGVIAGRGRWFRIRRVANPSSPLHGA
jgi:PEP-CTERM motif